MRRGPALAGRADSDPPVVTLETLGGVAAVNYDPSRCAGAQAAIEIAFQRIIRTRRPLKRRVHGGFNISIRSNHDAVAPGRIRQRQQGFLDGCEGGRPAVPVRIVA